MHQVLLSLGSNVGNREANLRKAVQLLGSETDSMEKRSVLYDTEPWGKSDQPNFYNQVIELYTLLSPAELLNKIHTVETKGGRKMTAERNAPRTIDIDILFYENLIITTEQLKIPHPLIHLRRFVLVPLAEIVPEFRHPVLGKTVIQLLSRCNDELKVKKVVK